MGVALQLEEAGVWVGWFVSLGFFVCFFGVLFDCLFVLGVCVYVHALSLP